MNYENKNELETSDTIKNTEIKSSKEEWKDIGKKWKKNCPDCGREQFYSTKCSMLFALKKNKRCLFCKNKGNKNPFYGKQHSDHHKKLLSSIQHDSGSYRYKNIGGNPPKLEKVCNFCKKSYSVIQSRSQSKYCCYKCAIKDNFGFEFGKKTKPELIIERFLIENNVEYEYNYEFSGKFYDFYIPDKNTLIEIDGIYWHGKNIKDEDLDHIQIKVKKRDRIKTRLAEENGYTLIRIWEDELENVQKYICRQEK